MVDCECVGWPRRGDCLHQLLYDVEDAKACGARRVEGLNNSTSVHLDGKAHRAHASTASCAAPAASWSAQPSRAAGRTTWTAAAQASERTTSRSARAHTHPDVRQRRVAAVCGQEEARAHRRVLRGRLRRPGANCFSATGNTRAQVAAAHPGVCSASTRRASQDGTVTTSSSRPRSAHVKCRKQRSEPKRSASALKSAPCGCAPSESSAPTSGAAARRRHNGAAQAATA
jgi:hypothetical protein